MIYNKKGDFNFVISIILVIIVVGIAIFALLGFNILGKLANYLPDFGFGKEVNGGESSKSEIELTYNEDGKCKPFEDEYRLNNGKLERLFVNVWENVDNDIPNSDNLLNNRLNELLKESEDKLSLKFEGEHEISLHFSGLSASFEDGNYVYTPFNTLKLEQVDVT